MTRTYREIKRQNVVEDGLESKVTGREGEKVGSTDNGQGREPEGGWTRVWVREPRKNKTKELW